MAETVQKNIVEFGLRNVYYAPVLTSGPASVTYGTPVSITGAVELSLETKGELVEFSADDITYFVSATNEGYEGTLKMALIPDQFKIDCLGEKLDQTSKVMVESAGEAEPKAFALMFEFQGDKKAVRHVLYHCKANRPKMASATGKSPNTSELSFRATPRMNDNRIKARSTEGTPKETYDNWYTSVFVPAK